MVLSNSLHNTTCSPSLLGPQVAPDVQWSLEHPEMETSPFQKTIISEEHSLEDRGLLVGPVVPGLLAAPGV